MTMNRRNWKIDLGGACPTAEAARDLAERQGLGVLPLERRDFSGPFTAVERLFYHVALFLIGSCSLVILDATETSRSLSSWPWVVGWGLVLLAHAGLVLMSTRRRRRAATRSVAGVD
jgi:hypothetical protein